MSKVQKIIAGMMMVLALVIVSNYKTALGSGVPSFFTVNKLTTATTTPVFMTPGTATTTYTFAAGDSSFSPSRDADATYMFLQYNASTTASEVDWKYQFSNDNVDWFDEDGTTATNAITTTHASTTITHKWIPNLTGFSRKVVAVPFFASNYKRVVFTTPIGTANGSLWIMDNTKRASY